MLLGVRRCVEDLESDDDEEAVDLVEYQRLVYSSAQSKIYLKSNSGQVLSVYRAVICNKKVSSVRPLFQQSKAFVQTPIFTSHNKALPSINQTVAAVETTSS